MTEEAAQPNHVILREAQDPYILCHPGRSRRTHTFLVILCCSCLSSCAKRRTNTFFVILREAQDPEASAASVQEKRCVLCALVFVGHACRRFWVLAFGQNDKDEGRAE